MNLWKCVIYFWLWLFWLLKRSHKQKAYRCFHSAFSASAQFGNCKHWDSSLEGGVIISNIITWNLFLLRYVESYIPVPCNEKIRDLMFVYMNSKNKSINVCVKSLSWYLVCIWLRCGPIFAQCNNKTMASDSMQIDVEQEKKAQLCFRLKRDTKSWLKRCVMEVCVGVCRCVCTRHLSSFRWQVSSWLHLSTLTYICLGELCLLSWWPLHETWKPKTRLAAGAKAGTTLKPGVFTVKTQSRRLISNDTLLGRRSLCLQRLWPIFSQRLVISLQLISD